MIIPLRQRSPAISTKSRTNSDENIADYIKEAVACIQKETDPTPLDLACMLAYYQSQGKPPHRHLMNDAKP